MNSLIQKLIKENFITKEQVDDARDKQIGAKKPLQELLVDMGFISEESLMEVLSRIYNMPVVKLEEEECDESVLSILSWKKAKHYGVFPLRKEENNLVLAMSNPQDIIAIDDIKIITELEINPVLCTKTDISKFIDEHYRLDDSLYDILKNVTDDKKIELIKDAALGKGEYTVQAFKGDESAMVRLTNLILHDAVLARASDIHIEPQEANVEIRYRVDGDLKDVMRIPRNLQAPLASRIKILSNLDIAETKKSQDGRVKVLIKSRKIDLRISVIPIYYGEKIAIRLLDMKEAKIDLNKIGFTNEDLSTFKDAISKPQGMILSTGPTGSGKTSSLYAALNFIKNETKNIITIEDPIEYLIEGINQMQINPIKDISFANSLKNILRQDPNIILVGEIRDHETAEIAFRSSLTGHLVFSTLHTNNAISSVIRLKDIGLEPYLIASSLNLIVAQRLVRVICSNCKELFEPNESVKVKFESVIRQFNINKFFKGKGCEKCGYTGFFGRTAIFEVLKITDRIKKLITDNLSEDVIFQEAIKDGFKTLVESGMRKVAEGVTTLEEIEKVCDVMNLEEKIVTPKIEHDGVKILVADDEEDIRKMVNKRLTDAGYDVVLVNNGREAVECAYKEIPDLIVMDIMMPEMDGFEATKILKSRLETASIPVVMLTAKKDKESELQGLDAGADDYITKPFDHEKLLARIKMLLNRRQR